MGSKYAKQAYSLSEFLTCLLSRELQDKTMGMVGAHSLIPMAACLLAQEMHAPDLTWISGTSGYVNPPPPLTKSSSEFRRRADAILSMNRIIQLQGRHLDFFFAGGLEFDPTGATNLVGTGNPFKRQFAFRGPGSAGVPFISRARRVFYYTTRHSPRVLVPQVTFKSALPSSTKDSSPPTGFHRKHLLVTSMAVFEFNPPHQPLTLVSIHPNIECEKLQDCTGFKVVKADQQSDVPLTPPPEEEELEVLRESIDPYRLLRRL